MWFLQLATLLQKLKRIQKQKMGITEANAKTNSKHSNQIANYQQANPLKPHWKTSK